MCLQSHHSQWVSGYIVPNERAFQVLTLQNRTSVQITELDTHEPKPSQNTFGENGLALQLTGLHCRDSFPEVLPPAPGPCRSRLKKKVALST